MDGKGMLIGHTCSQRPLRVQAFGRWWALSSPTMRGVSTDPIGPVYTQP